MMISHRCSEVHHCIELRPYGAIQICLLLLLLWQVKEMENIIRKRHPNSLPALIWAAASLPDDPVTKPQSVAFLESRILKLETELASKDEEAKKSMRALEQKYNSVKV